MTNFPNLPTIGASQVTNAGATSNDADAAVINGLANPRAETVDNTNAFAITNAASDYLWERNISWRFTDDASAPTAQITLTVPTTPARGLFGVINATGQAMQVETSAQVLTAPVIAAGDAALLSNDGTNVELLSSGGGGGGASTFEALTDAFAFAGNAGKVSAVNSGETALEAITLPNAINVPPSVRHVRTVLTAAQAITASTDTDIAWDGTEESTAFDPQDGGAAQRMWLGINWTFIDGDVTVGTDTIAKTAHGYSTGEGPIRLTSSGTLPAGLAVNTNYWIIAVDANSIKFASSRANAVAGTAVDITGAAGGGTHTVDQEDYLVVPANVAKVELRAGADWAAATDLARQITIKKRNASDADVAYEGRPASRVRGQDDAFQNIGSDAISVAEGDRFVLEVRHNSATTPLNVEATDMTWFSMRVVEETAAFTYPGVTVTPPARGALISRVADETGADYNAGGLVPFDDETYDIDGFHDNVTNNSRLTIPTGLGITKVRLSFAVKVDLLAAGELLRAHIIRNGSISFEEGLPFDVDEADVADNRLNGTSAYVDVAEGDYFELRLDTNGDASITVEAETWFAIEVVETDESAFPPEPVEFFINGTPGTSDLIFQKVASRRFTLSDDFAGSKAYFETAPLGGALVFDVDRNGAKIGEIQFADGVKTATFVTAAAAVEVFDVGDRLGIDSPADLFTAADLSIALWAWRS